MGSPPLAVLLEGTGGPRVLGLQVQERNARAARRAGLAVVRRAQDAPPDTHLVVVPETVLVEPALFQALPSGAAWPVRVEPGLVATDLARDVSTPGSRRRTARAILRASRKPTDGWISRNFNRPLSNAISYVLLNSGLRAGHASFLCLVIGLASAWFAAQTGWLTMAIAGGLFQLASMWDGVDGEMARATFSESSLGATVDTLIDDGTYLACIVGVTLGWAREGIGPAGAALAAFVLVGSPLTLVQVQRFVRRYGPDASQVFLTLCLEHAAAHEASTSLRAAARVFPAFRRDFYAALFFGISLLGSRAAVPAVVAAGLIVANLTLLAHWRALVRSARALRA